MSPQQKQQHEAITNINDRVSGLDDKVSDMAVLLTKMFKLWPIAGGVIAAASFIIGLTVKAVLWDQSIVKQPQFQAFKLQVSKDDSVLHVRIDTTNKRIDNIPALRFTKVIQRNGKEIQVN